MREEDAEELQKKIMSANFDFNDFLKQTRAVARMGSMSRVIGMIPGMGKVWIWFFLFIFATFFLLFLREELCIKKINKYIKTWDLRLKISRGQQNFHLSDIEKLTLVCVMEIDYSHTSLRSREELKDYGSCD